MSVVAEKVQAPVAGEALSMEEGYEIVSKLIFHQVHKFVRDYGGDFEDVLGEAHELFMKGHDHYVGGVRTNGVKITHTYPTAIRRWIWYGLFDSMRSRLKRKSIATFEPLNGHETKPGSPFYVMDFVSSLSHDGEYVTELVLNPSEELAMTVEAKGGTMCNYRSTVRSTLRNEGWSKKRINKAFSEITKALG